MTAPRFELMSQRQKASRLPTEPPAGRATGCAPLFSTSTKLYWYNSGRMYYAIRNVSGACIDIIMDKLGAHPMTMAVDSV